MTTFAWTIDKLMAIEADGLENVVTRIICTLVATSNDGLVTPQLVNVATGPWDAGSFIPFNELSQEIVVSWLEACIGEPALTQLKAGLESRFAEMRAALLDPPWESNAV